MTKLEEVARALFVADNTGHGGRAYSWDDDAKDWEREEYRNMARAAIEALHKPTSAMIHNVYNHPDIQAIRGEDILAVWDSMITAALTEGEEG